MLMWLSLILAACTKGPPSTEPSSCGPGVASACYEKGRGHLRGQPPQFDLAQAAESFEMACNDGHIEACLQLGLLVQDGRGIPQDYARAMALYQRVCDAGFGVGCLNLSFMYRLGNGVAANEAKASQYSQQALDRFREQCEAEKPKYCANLGYMLEHGFGVTLADPVEAGKVYERGCAAGEVDSCVNAAQLALDRGQSEVGKELARLEKACQEGSGLACGALGQLYWTRRFGIARDPQKALALANQGCDLGDAQACTLVGALLAVGEDLEPRPAESDAAERRACLLGKLDACQVVARTALTSWQQTQRLEDARVAGEFLGAACRIGDAASCSAFGAFVLQGALGPPDRELALTAFHAACRRLEFGACVELVRASKPLPLEEPALSEFLGAACQQGVQEACPEPLMPLEDPSRNGPSP
jgi:TPR repeat protein